MRVIDAIKILTGQVQERGENIELFVSPTEDFSQGPDPFFSPSTGEGIDCLTGLREQLRLDPKATYIVVHTNSQNSCEKAKRASFSVV